MDKKRPINLDLLTVKFPITAIASILHRISGVFIFFTLALLLFVLDESLNSAREYAQVSRFLDLVLVKFVLWLVLSTMVYHCVFGLRHMIQDLGYWETLARANLSAKLGFFVTIVLSILGGWLIW